MFRISDFGFRICLLAIAFWAWTPITEAAPPQAYRAARIWTGAGQPIADGVLLARDGKIVAVGPRAMVQVPEDAEVHDLGAAVLIPGLVIAETALGEHGRDDERSLTPDYRAIDGFDFYEDQFDILAGGVTTVQVSPGSRRLMPGVGAVVKLAGDNPGVRTLRERESLRVLLGDAYRNPPRIYEPPVGAVSVDKPLEPTRLQLSASLAGAMAGLRATLRAAKEYGQQATKGSEKDVILAAIADHLKQGGRLRVAAPAAADIRAALALAREFNLKLILVDPAGLEPFRDQLKTWNGIVDGVILNTEVRPGSVADTPVPDKEAPKRRPQREYARDLMAAGLKVAFRPASDSYLDDMLFLGGLCITADLPASEVLRMLTLSPAELIGVADRVGSLAVGKDADFVVLNGDPFALHTRVESVYVNGQPAYTSKAARKATVIQAAQIHLGTGEVVRDGAVLVEGTLIRGLGRDVSMPPGASIRRFDKAVIVPGFLDLATGLGVGGPLGGSVSLQTKLGDRLVAGDPAVGVARQGGVTTVLLAATGPAASPVLAFKLGDKPRVLQDPVAIRFGVTGNLTAQGSTLRSSLQQAKTYAESWAKFEAAQAEYEKKKRDYDAAKAKAEPAPKPAEGAKTEAKKEEAKKDDGKKEETKMEDAAKAAAPAEPKAPEKPRVVENMEPYRALFAGKIPAMVEAHRTDAIKLAVQVFRDEFKLNMVLLGGDDAFRLADLLAEKQVAVAVGPALVRTVEREPVNLAQVLANRGVPFGFQSRATTGVKTLPVAVQYAIRQGLGTGDALAGLTTTPAKFLALDKQVGTLAAGKDADLVVLSGPPFELSTRVLAVMIDGQWVFEEEVER